MAVQLKERYHVGEQISDDPIVQVIDDFVTDHDGPIWLLTNHRTEWLLPRLERFCIADRFDRVLVSSAILALVLVGVVGLVAHRWRRSDER